MIRLEELRFSINDHFCFKSVKYGILEHLVNLRHLEVWNNIPPKKCDTKLILLPFPGKMKSLKQVETLHLCQFSVPSWICVLGNLRELALTHCSSDYPALQNIYSLKVLSLKGNHTCTQLPKDFGKSGAFPNLSELLIQGFPLLEEFPALEDGAMQCLTTLKIWDFVRKIQYRAFSTTVEELQNQFEEETPASAKSNTEDYARNFLEFCCFKALHSSPWKSTPRLSDRCFSSFKFDMMVAWECPTAEQEKQCEEGQQQREIESEAKEEEDESSLFYSDLMPLLVHWLWSLLLLVAVTVSWVLNLRKGHLLNWV
ncbi:hypothetical protein KI387_003747 [Taxus chinensis]|uniref:Uncharacterized protein n=1 Tax=Taxus chinensis TaxID=29808 RepID=A0AA38LPZ9_TAXCH|nr:hypothetical protein KI387_003747 [Taxus chinensis]